MVEHESVSGRHLLALAGGALGIALAPLFVVWAQRSGGVGMMDAAFWRVAIGAGVLGLLRSFQGPKSGRRSASFQTWMWLPGLFLAADFAVWHLSFAHTSVANSTLLANFALILVVLFAWLFWKERFSFGFARGAVLAVVGASLLLVSSSLRDEVPVSGGKPLLGDALGLLTAVFYAAYLLSTKRYRRDHSARRLMLFSSTVAALVLLPVVLWHPDPFWPSSGAGWWALLGVGIISHAGGQGLIAYGLAQVPASLAAITLLLQPVCTAVLGYLLLGQGMTPLQLSGAILVVIGLGFAVQAQTRPSGQPTNSGE